MKMFTLLLFTVLSTCSALDFFGKKGGFGLPSVGLPAGLPVGLPSVGLPPLFPKDKGHDSCTVVEDDVWEEKCRTLFDNVCEDDHVDQCKLVPQQQCRTVHEEQCNVVIKDKCKVIDVPKCNIVWEKKCIWERQCNHVPSTCNNKKSKGFLPRLWKRSLGHVAHDLVEKKAYKLDKINDKLHHNKGHNKGYNKGYHGKSLPTIHLEPELCQPSSEICENVEKCKDYPNKQCGLEPKEKCVPLPHKDCHVIPKEHCQKLQVEVCKPVPRSVCKSVPRKECEKQLVKRPRKVCVPPPVVTVKQDEVAW